MTAHAVNIGPDHDGPGLTADITGAPVLLSRWWRASFTPQKIRVIGGGGGYVMVSGPRDVAQPGRSWRSKKYVKHDGVWRPRMADWLVRVVAEVDAWEPES